VALLWGEDDFLLREAALQVLAGVQPVEVDARQWRGGEVADLATPSMLGEERALLVTGCRRLSQAAIKELSAYLADPAPDATLVLSADVSERGTAPAALSKLVRAAGGQVRQVAVARKDLPAWVVERARSHAGEIAPDAARVLVETIGDHPASLDAAVQQVLVAYPGRRIDRRSVLDQFRGLGERRVWELCDRAFGRDLPGSVRALRSLVEAREDPLVILGGVASRLRDLVRVKALPERLPAGDVARAAGLRFEWQARRFRDQARRFEMAELLGLHARVVEADRELKSGGSGDVVLPVVVAAVAGGGAA
jgi:DNA polymerase-3 subunit delta